MLPRYFTVKGYGETEIDIKRSRFISYAERVETEEKAQAFIAAIKKKHWNATHNCSAYIIGEQDHIQKADDDGEPSGTAGKPILEVIKNNHVKDTVIVVTRYFGGIKLGAGGLIRAYGKGASAGLKASKIVERVLHQAYRLKMDYTFLGKIENELRAREEYIISDIAYLEMVTVTILVEVGQEQSLLDWVMNATNGQVKVEAGEKEYVEFSVEPKDT
jgi:uncharacterized YigZ family protein